MSPTRVAKLFLITGLLFVGACSTRVPYKRIYNYYGFYGPNDPNITPEVREYIDRDIELVDNGMLPSFVDKEYVERQRADENRRLERLKMLHSMEQGYIQNSADHLKAAGKAWNSINAPTAQTIIIHRR